MLKYTCGIREVLCVHVTSLSIVRNFTWAGCTCITQKYLGVKCITNFTCQSFSRLNNQAVCWQQFMPTFILTILKQIALRLLVFFFNRCNQVKVGAFFPRCCYSNICQWRGIHLFTEMNSWIIWDTHLLSSFHWKHQLPRAHCQILGNKFDLLNPVYRFPEGTKRSKSIRRMYTYLPIAQ